MTEEGGLSGMEENGVENLWAKTPSQATYFLSIFYIVILFCCFFPTRSYAALRAVDLDWIVRPGYSLGRVHSGKKTMKNQPGTMKNHENFVCIFCQILCFIQS